MSEIVYRKACLRDKYIAIADGKAIIVDICAINEFMIGVTEDEHAIRFYGGNRNYEPCTKAEFEKARSIVTVISEKVLSFFEELND